MTRDSQAEPELFDGPAIGSTIGGKYVVEALLGRGGMGAVYRARHNVTGRRVAIKWLLDTNASLRQRFLREARAMGFVEHPSVVSVLDVGEHEGAAFIVMELLRGQSLRDFLDGRPCTIGGAVDVIMPALEGLAALHGAGIVHRDLKPDNVFVCQDSAGYMLTTKLLDLGVARLRGSREHDDLTVSGAIIGTPRYMAPEQLRGMRDVDARADIFALGLILYEMFTGRLPYDASTYESLVIDIVTSDAPSPRVFRPELPDALANVVLKALARDRENRFADVAALAHALEPYAESARYTAPTADHVRGSYVPESATSDAPVANTPDGEPRKSAEPTALRRGAKGGPVVPLRRAAPVATPRMTPIANAETVAEGAVTDSVYVLPVPRVRQRIGIALAVFGVVAIAVAAILELTKPADVEAPVAVPSTPAPAPAPPPREAPIVAQPTAPVAAPVAPIAPAIESDLRGARRPARVEPDVTPPAPTTATPPTPPPTTDAQMRSRPMLQVDQF